MATQSRLLFVDTDSLVYEIETENAYDDFSKYKEIIYFSTDSAKSKYYDDSNELAVGKMRGEMGGLMIEEFLLD